MEFKVYKQKEDGTWVSLIVGEEIREVPVGEDFVEPVRFCYKYESVSQVLNAASRDRKSKKEEKVKKEKVEEVKVFNPRPGSLIEKVRNAIAKVGWNEFKVIQEVKEFEKDEKKIIGRYRCLRSMNKKGRLIVGLDKIKIKEV